MASTFPGLMSFAFMAGLLVLGTVLRAKLAPLRQALIPASMIGGIVGFILLNTGVVTRFTGSDFIAITFHCFTLSFMSLCLTGASPAAREQGMARGGLWMSLVWSMSLVMQAVVGIGVIFIYDAFTGAQIHVALGALVTHGFTQGPGQALAYGTIWESDYGITNAATLGLIYASFGFIVAFLVGVPLARWMIRRGLNSNQASQLDDAFLAGIHKPETNESAGRQVTHGGNVDTLAWHIGLLGIAYLLTDLWLGFMQPIVADTRPLGISLPVLFSHNLFFLHGLVVCLIIRRLLDIAGLSRFIDDGTQKRITGSAVDFMVLGTLLSIQFTVLSAFLVPALLVALAATLVTVGLCFGLARRLPAMAPERSLTSFGCCCGSTGTGLLLLRILDPDFSTSVARELAFFNVAILILTLHVLMVVVPVLPDFSTLTIVVIYLATFAVYLVAMFLLFRPTASQKSAAH